nr:uro-adherence factor A isoform X4 [Drosophila suzukii]
MTIVLNLAICVFLLLGTVVPSKGEMQDPDIDLLVQLHTGTDEQSQSQLQNIGTGGPHIESSAQSQSQLQNIETDGPHLESSAQSQSQLQNIGTGGPHIESAAQSQSKFQNIGNGSPLPESSAQSQSQLQNIGTDGPHLESSAQSQSQLQDIESGGANLESSARKMQSQSQSQLQSQSHIGALTNLQEPNIRPLVLQPKFQQDITQEIVHAIPQESNPQFNIIDSKPNKNPSIDITNQLINSIQSQLQSQINLLKQSLLQQSVVDQTSKDLSSTKYVIVPSMYEIRRLNSDPQYLIIPRWLRRRRRRALVIFPRAGGLEQTNVKTSPQLNLNQSNSEQLLLDGSLIPQSKYYILTPFEPKKYNSSVDIIDRNDLKSAYLTYFQKQTANRIAELERKLQVLKTKNLLSLIRSAPDTQPQPTNLNSQLQSPLQSLLRSQLKSIRSLPQRQSQLQYQSHLSGSLSQTQSQLNSLSQIQSQLDSLSLRSLPQRQSQLQSLSLSPGSLSQAQSQLNSQSSGLLSQIQSQLNSHPSGSLSQRQSQLQSLSLSPGSLSQAQSQLNSHSSGLLSQIQSQLHSHSSGSVSQRLSQKQSLSLSRGSLSQRQSQVNSQSSGPLSQAQSQLNSHSSGSLSQRQSQLNSHSSGLLSQIQSQLSSHLSGSLSQRQSQLQSLSLSPGSLFQAQSQLNSLSSGLLSQIQSQLNSHSSGSVSQRLSQKQSLSLSRGSLSQRQSQVNSQSSGPLSQEQSHSSESLSQTQSQKQSLSLSPGSLSQTQPQLNLHSSGLLSKMQSHLNSQLSDSLSQIQSQLQTQSQSHLRAQNPAVSFIPYGSLLPRRSPLPVSPPEPKAILQTDLLKNAKISVGTSEYKIYSPPKYHSQMDILDDSKLTTVHLIEKYGYPSETHFVNSDDGYKLCVHRIPRPGAKPVLLVHGLMSSSASWVELGPKNGLAYILYRKGYDVWMLNTRGNKYSRDQTGSRKKPRKYWNFSFHEIGKYDVPATIDLILKRTNEPKLQYIGHSQGSTVFFVMCSEKPKYANKVQLMQALSPTVYLQENRSPVLKFISMFKGKYSMLLNLLGGYEISAKTKLIEQFRQHICSTSELASQICAIFDFVLCGFDWKSFNKTLTPIVAAHASQGASAKQIYHYAQLQGDQNFQHFDHGPVLNRVRYESSAPPAYNLSQTTTKVVIHHGGGDWLGSDSDVNRLQQSLPNLVESRKVNYDGFSHYDFTLSKDVRPLVYSHVLRHLSVQLPG